MAPLMAATVFCSSVFVVFLFFVSQTRSVFTRDELRNNRQNTPQNILQDFDYSDVLLDTVVGGAALFRRYRTRRRGKRAGTLVTVWFSLATKSDRRRLWRVVRTAE